MKELTTAEMVECLVSPLREPSEFLESFQQLEESAWYIHHTPKGRFYFDRQENLTKLLQSLAHDAPENTESEPDDEGTVRLRINAQNAGPAPPRVFISPRTRPSQ